MTKSRITLYLLSATFSLLIYFKFGLHLTFVFAALLTWGLIILSLIDIRLQLLPDVYTLPLLALGLCANYFHLFTSFSEAIIGALLGYYSLWLVAKLFKKLRGYEGMGYGDFKLFALLGAWLGASNLLSVLFLSALSALLFYFILSISKKITLTQKLPFGPFLALGGVIILLHGRFLY